MYGTPIDVVCHDHQEVQPPSPYIDHSHDHDHILPPSPYVDDHYKVAPDCGCEHGYCAFNPDTHPVSTDCGCDDQYCTVKPVIDGYGNVVNHEVVCEPVHEPTSDVGIQNLLNNDAQCVETQTYDPISGQMVTSIDCGEPTHCSDCGAHSCDCAADGHATGPSMDDISSAFHSVYPQEMWTPDTHVADLQPVVSPYSNIDMPAYTDACSCKYFPVTDHYTGQTTLSQECMCDGTTTICDANGVCHEVI